MLGIKITELKREDVSEELANKYFVNSYGSSIDRFHIPELTAEEYEAFVSKANYKRMKPANLKFASASEYFKDKVRKDMVAKDLGYNIDLIDFSDYIKDERFYEWFDTDMQILHYNMEYRTPSVRDDSANVVRESYATGLVDKEELERLEAFCTNVIKRNIAMLLTRVDDALDIINMLKKDSEGLKFNVAKGPRLKLRWYINYYKKTLADEEFQELIKVFTDVDFYAENEATRRHFVETYLKLYEKIGLDFTETELFEKYADPEDAEILNIEFTSYNENELGDDEDEGYEEEEEVVASETDAEEA